MDINQLHLRCLKPALLLIVISILLVVSSFGFPFCGGRDAEEGTAGTEFATPMNEASPEDAEVSKNDSPVDTDSDGIIDAEDNCGSVANPEQENSDDNPIGDLCQDSDNDTVIDIQDNCPL